MRWIALLTLRHIEVFRAIMQTGSVTEAAALLNTSQPTVSELARMEYVCGMRLFERGKGRLQAAAAGTLFGEVQRAYPAWSVCGRRWRRSVCIVACRSR
jgi:DNA-binding transcriptional LysR family regulator